MRTHLVVFLAVIGFASPVGAEPFYVNGSVASSGNGASWPQAFKTIQEALEEASLNSEYDRIFVAQGTYVPTDGSNRAIAFGLISDVEILGGYIGAGADPNTRDIALYESILSGDLSQNDNVATSAEDLNHVSRDENSYNVVEAVSTNIQSDNCLLDGFTITGGNADSSTDADHRHGAGIRCGRESPATSSSPTVRECTIKFNRVHHDDSGIAAGGGLAALAGSEPFFRHCTVTDNLAADSDAIGGGAYSTAQLKLLHCEVARNVADGLIGAIDGGGGGLAVYLGGADVISCTIVDNQAAVGGGIAVSSAGSDGLRLINSLVVRNSAALLGGGVWNDKSRTQLINCTIAGNTANEEPSSSGYGDNVHIDGDASIVNSILWANGNPGESLTSFDFPVSVTYSDVELVFGEYSGVGNINADPAFIGDPNYRLELDTSPCIDIGDVGAVPDDVFDVDEDGKADQAGNSEPVPDADLLHRIVGLGVDMGAHERCPADIDANGTVDVDDLMAVLMAWGPCPPTSCPADVDGNNAVDVDDLIAVILNWEDCDLKPMPASVEDCIHRVKYQPEGVISCFEAAELFED